MCDHPYRVGEALAYLVQRMETFCSTRDGDVFTYEQGRRGIPKRTPATDVLGDGPELQHHARGVVLR